MGRTAFETVCFSQFSLYRKTLHGRMHLLDPQISEAHFAEVPSDKICVRKLFRKASNRNPSFTQLHNFAICFSIIIILRQRMPFDEVGIVCR